MNGPLSARFRCGVVTMFVGAAPLGAQGLDDGMLDDVVSSAVADPDLVRGLETCPSETYGDGTAALFGLISGRGQPSSVGICRELGGACYPACLDGDGAACFDLGFVVQRRAAELPAAQLVSESFFARACYLGVAAGCTNRAAGIMREFDGDPLVEGADDSGLGCAHATFALSCEDGDPWGCTMLGLTFAFGEGVEKDADRARAALARVCEGQSDQSEPCVAARDIRAKLDSE